MISGTVYIDITNLLAQDFLTGIQRVVREVVLRLCRRPELQVVLLCVEPATQEFIPVSEQEFRRALDGQPPHPDRHAALQVCGLKAGGIFYDIDAVWGAQPHRAWLYPELKKHGVKIVTFVHDIIPITEPQYCYPNTMCQFMDYTGAVLSHADAVFVSTEATRRELRELQTRVQSPCMPILVTGLGADFAAGAQAGAVSAPVTQALGQQPYILLVSTLEPRKNHALLLDAFDMGLYEEGLCLVFAGRIGWGVDGLQKRLRSHPQFGRRLLHFAGQNDATIDHLYRHAFLTAYPSFNEGFGLPIIESLERGVPAVVSDRNVLKEVGKEFCLYCDPYNPAEWANLFRELLHNPDRMALLRKQLGAFRAPTWDEATGRMAAYLIDILQQ